MRSLRATMLVRVLSVCLLVGGLVVIPAGSALAGSCPTTIGGYLATQRVHWNNAWGTADIGWITASQANGPCLFVSLLDKVDSSNRCVEVLFDWVETQGHYDSRVFINCRDAVTKMRVVDETNRDPGWQQLAQPRKWGFCQRDAAPTPSAPTNRLSCATLQLGDIGSIPENPNTAFSDFYVWDNAGTFHYYDSPA
jgi:hypothetical protein